MGAWANGGAPGAGASASNEDIVRTLPLLLWLAADQQPQSDGGAPYYLFDRSGQANHLDTSGGGLTYVADSVNDLPAWRFDGSSYAGIVRRGVPGGSPALTVSAVLYLASFVGTPEVLQVGVDHATSLASMQFALWADGAMYSAAFGGEGNERYSAAGSVPATTWMMLTWVVSPGAFSASNPAFRKNKVVLSSTRGAGASTPQIIPAIIQLGANLQGTPAQILPANSKLAEIIVANTDSATHVAQIEAYLSEKYGL